MNGNKTLHMLLALLMLVNVFYGVPAMKARAEPADSSWQARSFGNGVSSSSNTVTVNGDGSITVESKGDKGKISNNADGISFYFTALEAGKPFQITARAHVDSFTPSSSSPNQVSFGLMLRNTLGEDGKTAGHTSDFVAVGALNQKMQAFCRKGTVGEADGNAKLAAPVTLSDVLPKAGDDYILRIIKTSEDQCVVSCGAQTAVIDAKGLFTGEQLFLGLFTARNTKVTFSEVSLVTEVDSLEITGKPAKTDYYAGESLDLTGLEVTAGYADGSTAVLSAKDYVVAGFGGYSPGVQTVSLYYGGKTTALEVLVKPLQCTALQITYTPAKTTYYIDDAFDPFGLVVTAVFNSGATRELGAGEYTLTGFDSSTGGEKTVTATLGQDKSIQASFKVTVVPSRIQSLEITRKPAKTLYYIGEPLDLGGLVVSAWYGNSKVMLQSDEYAVDTAGFDTAAAGQKTVLVSCKGKTVSLPLTVKVKELKRIEVSTLPRTTYTAGEAFNPGGMLVSRVYDNLDRETLAQTEYTLDAAAFKSDVPGTYDIGIIPGDKALAPITFPVTVREKTAYIWKSTVFGQSIRASTNFVEASDPGTADGTVKLTALEGGGKVTGAHDGISFYYTEIDGTKDNFVLSADIRVIAFAKATPDNQEAFGLMARDAIGKDGDSSIFSSNIAAVGGYRGKTQAFIRTGVTNPLGNEGTVQTATAWSTARPSTANTYPDAAYRLTLAKTNSGYTASLNNAADTTVLFYEPDALGVQDAKIYVGFYAARLATIEVSNVDFSVSAAATDAVKVPAPPKPAVPDLKVISLPNASKSDYALQLLPNVNGTVTVKQGETVIAGDVPVTAGQVFTQKTKIAASSDTNFTLTFTPDAAQALASYDRRISHFAVTMKTYETADGAIYVSPAGKSAAAGTREDPLDLDTAVKYVKEGQTIYLLGGTYSRTAPVVIPAGNDGTASAVKSLAADKGQKVILDFGTKSTGFALAGSYWNIRGLEVTKASGVGFAIGGSYNKVEFCKVYANGDTGLQISRIGGVAREYWPAYNLVLNCEAYDNRDASENNADGFAAKLTCGEGNVFRGCIAHHNIDDGWDLYTKAESGPIGAVLIEDCIAYNNGMLTTGYAGKGDKNGFKLGGEGIAVPHVIKNSIAFGNGAAGFTSNSNPAVQAADCVSFDNTGANISFGSYAGIALQFTVDGFISYRSKPGAADSYPDSAASGTNYFCDGTSSANTSGVVLNDSDFEGLTPDLPYRRDADGKIIRGSFLKFIPPAVREK